MTKIEWTQREGTKGETWNPIRARNKKTGGIGHFCTKVSAGCQNCYAADFQKRFKNTVRYAAQDADQVELFLDEVALIKPLRWKKPRTIFVCSMTDLFYEGHQSNWIDQVFAVIALCPQHTFIILTKRHDRMREYISLDTSAENVHEILSFGGPKNWDCHKELEALGGKYFSGQYGEFGMCELPPGYEDIEFEWPLKNVWLGVSVEDQKAAEERIPVLLDTPAAVRFLSVEPLLGPVDLTHIAHENGDSDQYYNAVEGYEISCGQFQIDGLNWVIVGGESGHNARPMHPDWARSLRDQCKAAGVPFFFKQWGTWAPVDEYPSGKQSMNKVGKKRAGRSLDGVEHNEWPEVKPC